MFDSHCHLDDPSFSADLGAVLDRAGAAGVTDILLPAIRPDRYAGLLTTIRAPSAVRRHLALGIHPQVVPFLSDLERASLATLPRQLEEAGAVAVGECGLDGPTGHVELQAQMFRAQIRIARDMGLPVIVHSFHAHEAVLRILKEERVQEVGGVAHSFSGSAELVPRYLDLGLAISFAGAITWARARKPLSAARKVPDALLLVETDGPDQAPAAVRGLRTEPGALIHNIKGLAAAREQSLEHVAQITTANARRIFRLAPSYSS